MSSAFRLCPAKSNSGRVFYAISGSREIDRLGYVLRMLLGYTAWHYDWRPDAMDWAETIRERIEPTLFNKEGVEIVSCKYVKCSALDEARKTYPT